MGFFCCEEQVRPHSFTIYVFFLVVVIVWEERLEGRITSFRLSGPVRRALLFFFSSFPHLFLFPFFFSSPVLHSICVRFHIRCYHWTNCRSHRVTPQGFPCSSAHQMQPPLSLQSPCFPIHAVLRRFDLSPGTSAGVVLQHIGPPPSSSSSLEMAQSRDTKIELVLFPCKFGDPTCPIGWPPPTCHECTVLVNQSYVTDGIPRCPTRSASHRTLAGLPLSPYLCLRETGGTDSNMSLKIVVTSQSTWSATFLLAWCRVVELGAVIEQTIMQLRQQDHPVTESNALASLLPPLDADSDSNTSGWDVDVDRGWVDDEGDVDSNDGRNGGKAEDKEGCRTAVEIEDDYCMSNCEALLTLRCPLSYRRMRLAGRGRCCTHLGCFDVVTYLESSLRSNAWNCPICDGPVFIDSLRLDRTVQTALETLGPEEESIVLFGDDHREWRGVQRAEGTFGNDDDDDDSMEEGDADGVTQQQQRTHAVYDVAGDRSGDFQITLDTRKRARSEYI